MAKLLLIVAIGALLYFWWRGHGETTKMSPSEARRLLGVDDDADAAAIRAAHRRLIARVHPDSGGNEELARKINAARDLLLKSGVQQSHRDP